MEVWELKGEKEMSCCRNRKLARRFTTPKRIPQKKPIFYFKVIEPVEGWRGVCEYIGLCRFILLSYK